MVRGRGVAVLLVILSLVPAPTVGFNDSPDPAQSGTLVVGSNDEMKTRNVLTTLALGDPHTMVVLSRVYDTAVQRDATTGAVVPRLAVGIDGDGDGLLDPAEVGDFSYTVGTTDLTVFYDFGAARFHDGVSVSVWDVLFSYHVLALHPFANGPFRVLMDNEGSAGSNYTTTRWLGIAPVDDGDGNSSTAALRFNRQFPYVNFATLTLGVPVLPMHVWSRTFAGRHADTGCAIWLPPAEATAKGISECGNPDASRWGLGIGPMEVVSGSKPFDLLAAMWWNPVNADVIGSGHFRFDYWTPGIAAQLLANADYAFGPPTVDGVLFRVYKTTQLLVFALQAGQIDLILGRVSPEFYPDLQRTPGIAVLEVEDVYPAALYFNLRGLPFGYSTYPPPDRIADQSHVLRRAMAHLLDRQSMLTNLLQGHGRVADSMVSPANGAWHNASVPTYPFGLATAAAILDSPEGQSAGIGPDPPGVCNKDNDLGCRSLPSIGPVEFEMLTPQADYDPVLASSGAMLADAMRQVGINALSRPTAWGEILTRSLIGDFDLFLAMSPEHRAIDPWSLLRGDPDYLFESFHSSNAAAGRNLAGFWDIGFDGAAGASRLEMDFMPRDFHVRNTQGVLAERLPAIPLVYSNWTWAYRIDRFIGWQLVGGTVFNYWTLQALDVAPPPNAGPAISLLAPANGTVFVPGRVIDLDIVDTDLDSVEYALDGGPAQPLAAPWDLDTTSWMDGDRTLQVTATDLAGTSTYASFDFIVDSVPPAISLQSPTDNAVVRGGEMDFDIVEPHLASSQVTIDGLSVLSLAPPFTVSLTGLLDGIHAFDVEATDLAGNTASATYRVTVDTVSPQLRLVTPANASLLGARATIDFEVEDLSLAAVSVRADGAAFEPLVAPYDVVLEDLLPVVYDLPAQGLHTVEVTAVDAAGNTATMSVAFTLDSIAPAVIERTPAGTAPIAPTIHVRFSEAVNRSSVEVAFSISDGTRTWSAADGTFAWSEDGRSFLFVPGGVLTVGRSHEVRLAGSLMDLAGNPMGTDIAWSLTPQEMLPVVSLLVSLAIIFAAALSIAALLLIRRRKKAGRDEG